MTPYDNDVHHEFMRRLEDLKREADWRSIGQQTDQPEDFARRVNEILRELLFFIDNNHDEMEDHERQCNDRVNEIEYQLENAEAKIAAVEQYIQKQRAISELEKILKGI